MTHSSCSLSLKGRERIVTLAKSICSRATTATAPWISQRHQPRAPCHTPTPPGPVRKARNPHACQHTAHGTQHTAHSTRPRETDTASASPAAHLLAPRPGYVERLQLIQAVPCELVRPWDIHSHTCHTCTCQSQSVMISRRDHQQRCSGWTPVCARLRQGVACASTHRGGEPAWRGRRSCRSGRHRVVPERDVSNEM